MKRILTLAVLGATAVAASAHTGHGTASLVEGLAHPLGADHLLAMVAVGVWSCTVMAGARRWLGPLVFLAAMTVGAALGMAGLTLPLTEVGIAMSVSMLGAMLLVGGRLPANAGLVLIAAVALLHGLAHGAETPAGGSLAAYAGGFLAATTLLHVTGVGFGAALCREKAAVWRALGMALGGAGLVLLLIRV